MDGSTAALIVGALGLITGLVSIAYTRTQAAATHRQAEESARVAKLASDAEMFRRAHEMRLRFAALPGWHAKIKAARPEIAEVFDRVGADAYYALRDAFDTFQEVYFLRRAGAVTDEYWHSWTNATMPTIGRSEDGRLVFELSARAGFLHPDFVEFFRPLIEGRALADPAPRRG